MTQTRTAVSRDHNQVGLELAHQAPDHLVNRTEVQLAAATRVLAAGSFLHLGELCRGFLPPMFEQMRRLAPTPETARQRLNRMDKNDLGVMLLCEVNRIAQRRLRMPREIRGNEDRFYLHHSH